MVRLLISVLLAAYVAAALPCPPAMAQTPESTLETVVELPPETPYEQEMLLLRIKGVNYAPITVQSLDQPDLRNFAWMQLGRDQWFEDMVNGRKAMRFERIMALFPQRPGRLQIGTFVHNQTVLNARGQREEIRIASQPLSVEVRAKPVGAGWWLPARSLTINDSWDKPPDRLGLGEIARRTVTIEADGIGPELLPPIPSLRSPGIVAFFDPEERTTVLTSEGPISTVTWRWSIKGATSTPATVREVRIPWFDTRARVMREVTLEPREVRLASVATDTTRPFSAWQAGLPAIGIVAFLAGLALTLWRRRLRPLHDLAGRLRWLVPDRLAIALLMSVRSGDTRSTWLASHRLIRRRAGAAGTTDWNAAGFRELDEAVFGPPGTRPALNLKSIAWDVFRRQRR